MPARDKLLRSVILAVAYIVTGKLGLELAYVHTSATAVWPPTGITLAAMLLWGRGVWPGAFVGAFIVNVTTDGSVLTSAGIALGNTLEGIAGSYLLDRYAGGCEAYRHAPSVFRAALAALCATTVSPTIGGASLVLGGGASSSQFGSIWLTWWLGDAVAALVVAPVIVLWSIGPKQRWPFRALAELALALVSLAGVAFAVFGGWMVPGSANYPLEFLVVPFLLWPAFRFGPRETATATLLLSIVAISGTLAGNGPFARPSANESLLLLQGYTGIKAMTMLAVAALVLERKRLLRRAEESVHARDEFLGIASHELRTPLTVLQLAVQGLKESVDNGTLPVAAGSFGERAVATAERQVQRFGRLVDRLLDLSRAQSGRLDLVLGDVDLAAVARDVGAQWRPQLEAAGSTFRVRAPKPVWGRWDGARLEQVIGNLLSNAHKYAAGAPVELVVDGTRAVATLVVEDHGIGIDPARCGAIFEPFERAASADRYPGLGLGLYVSRQIVLGHGGVIRVASTNGGGTTFVVELPLAPPAVQPDAVGT